MFPYEKLEVYWVAVEFEAVSERLVKEIRARAPKLADQLETATDSITLNICEGATYYWPSEKAKYYRYSRGSVNEASGIIGRSLRRKLIDPELGEQGVNLLKRLSVMLFHLIERMEQEAANGRTRETHNRRPPKRPNAPPPDATTPPDAPPPDATTALDAPLPDAPPRPRCALPTLTQTIPPELLEVLDLGQNQVT